MNSLGTIVRGIRTPIIKEGDNLVEIVVDSVISSSKNEKFELEDRDIIAVTEAVVSISSGNYASLDQIAKDVKNKFNKDHIGIVFPIFSRNRFAVCLQAFARATKKLTVLLNYPSDEVGNDILDRNKLKYYDINPFSDVISEEEYEEKFGDFKHSFTGVNIIDFYREVINKENCEVEFILSNNPLTILNYTKDVICADIHSRKSTKKVLKNNGGRTVLGLDEIMNRSVDGSGYNPEYGLLGSNRATEEKVKLFPYTGEKIVYEIQEQILNKTGKKVEVMVYGDGAFKDPIGQIWELADPVVSPAYTKGLEGGPNELKLKYLSDNKYKGLNGEDLNNAIRKEIREKNKNLVGTIESQGTTPRRYVDLIGSLCDLTSGSGDKGTPVVLVQRYFKNYADID